MPLNKSSELRRRLSRANHTISDSSNEELSANTDSFHEADMADECDSVFQSGDLVVEIENQLPNNEIVKSPQELPADDLLCVTSNTVVNRVSVSNKQSRDTIKQGEEEMAEVDTNMLSTQHGDIRREAAAYAADIRYGQAGNTADIRREIATSADQVADITLEQAGNVRREAQAGFGQTRFDTATGFGDSRYNTAVGFNESIKESIKGDWHVTDTIKDTRYDLASRVENSADRVTGQASDYFIAAMQADRDAARELAALRTIQETGIASIRAESALNAERLATAAALEAAKNQAANALGQAQVSRDIFMDGDRTRALINDLKYHDLNRSLIERNNELVEERNWGKHWYHGANQAQFGQQFAQLQSQMQNFNSQLSETRQGMVNFGTMAGVGQTSSANNVR